MSWHISPRNSCKNTQVTVQKQIKEAVFKCVYFQNYLLVIESENLKCMIFLNRWPFLQKKQRKEWQRANDHSFTWNNDGNHWGGGWIHGASLWWNLVRLMSFHQLLYSTSDKGFPLSLFCEVRILNCTDGFIHVFHIKKCNYMCNVWGGWNLTLEVWF